MASNGFVEKVTIFDYGRIGQVALPNSERPSIMLLEYDDPDETFVDMLARSMGVDASMVSGMAQLIEALGGVLLARRSCLDKSEDCISAMYLSEESYAETHTVELIESLERRQGLSPLHVWVRGPRADLWRKVRPHGV